MKWRINCEMVFRLNRFCRSDRYEPVLSQTVAAIESNRNLERACQKQDGARCLDSTV